MKNTLKYLSWGAAGLMSGLTLAQVIFVSAERAGGNPGGEIVIPIAIPLLLLAGYIVGRDTPRIEDYDRGYDEGYEDGCKCTVAPKLCVDSRIIGGDDPRNRGNAGEGSIQSRT